MSNESKYDWNRLKLEFFQSKAIDVKSFFEISWYWFNAYVTKHTKGWREEKKHFRDEAKKEALEQAKKEAVAIYKPSIEELNNIHQLLVLTMSKKAMSMALKWPKKIQKTDWSWNPIIWKDGKPETYDIDDSDDIDAWELKKIWEMTKIEKWEPTTINENNNTGDTAVVQFTIEMPK